MFKFLKRKYQTWKMNREAEAFRDGWEWAKRTGSETEIEQFTHGHDTYFDKGAIAYMLHLGETRKIMNEKRGLRNTTLSAPSY